MGSEPLVPIGKVVNTHGLKGYVKVIPYGETLASLGPGETVTVCLPDARARLLTTVEVRPHRKTFLFLCREINTVEEARSLLGAELCVPEARLAPLASDEFYWYQLIKLRVVNSDGRELGTIEEICPTRSNDVYVVRQGNEEILIPATHSVVRQVDLQRRLMLVDLPKTACQSNDL
ncbi:MAG: ribosome maturation factor RimM [Syntrophobacteria bacterium]